MLDLKRKISCHSAIYLPLCFSSNINLMSSEIFLTLNILRKCVQLLIIVIIILLKTSITAVLCSDRCSGQYFRWFIFFSQTLETDALILYVLISASASGRNFSHSNKSLKRLFNLWTAAVLCGAFSFDI